MVVLPNMPQMIIAYYGALKMGAVVVLSNPEANAAQIVHQLAQTGARVLVTLRDFSPLIEQVQRESSVEKIILADMGNAVSKAVYKKLLKRWGIPEALNPLPLQGNCLLMADLMVDAIKTPLAATVHPTDLAAIV